MSEARLFSSTIIPTINRPTLSAAVRSVLDQDTEADFEVIVVNDSGTSLPDADWRRSERVRVIDVPGRERSACRNTGAAVAVGKYLHFLDDDDILLPGALERFRELGRTLPDDVSWLYGGYQSVDNGGQIIGTFRPEVGHDAFAMFVAGESIPFQASFLDNRRFFAAGAFDAAPDLLGVEDRDLGRRMALLGSLAGTEALVARIRVGEQGSTTRWDRIAEGDRIGREKALSAPGALGRLRESARSGYWRGRVARAYGASAVRNATRGAMATALGRAACAAVITTWHPVLPAFWKGLATQIRSRTTP